MVQPSSEDEDELCYSTNNVDYNPSGGGYEDETIVNMDKSNSPNFTLTSSVKSTNRYLKQPVTAQPFLHFDSPSEEGDDDSTGVKHYECVSSESSCAKRCSKSAGDGYWETQA